MPGPFPAPPPKTGKSALGDEVDIFHMHLKEIELELAII